ncbi:MAG: alpha-N-acetylglucosaminidase [Clostridiales bacterium]|nr:alpha-N-acetylglucosaminidase [Clostridiales bacterium]
MHDLIKRNTPGISLAFTTEIIEKSDGKNTYEIEAQNGKIVLRGDCTISIAMAYYRYLREYCAVNLAWCGNTRLKVDAAPLPERKITHIVEQEKRACMNYRAFAYSTVWWDWERWEREIDFMAMNGINMPLSIVGSEAVWYHTLRDFGYSEQGALQYISGPCYWSWQLITHFDTNLALTDTDYVEKRLELGKKIIKRETELGMTPIMQGFSGHVPRTVIRLLKKARLRHNPAWNNFATTYQIEPSDPHFKKFGKALLEKQLRLLGANHYYACDPLYDSTFSPRSGEYFKSLGKAVSALYQSFDSEAVWVMQGDHIKEKMVKAVPKDRILILDIDGNGHKSTDGYWGYNFILGTKNNTGGRNTLHGSISDLAQTPYLQAKTEYPNIVGTGIFPESICQNPLYFDLALEMLTQNKAVDLDKWLKDYAQRRYGSNEECLSDAVLTLKDSCYSEKCTGPETGSIICSRPSTELSHAAIGDTMDLRYDNKLLFYAADAMLLATKAETDGYSYDVCDVTRQTLSNHARIIYRDVMEGYRTKDPRKFEVSSNAFLRLFEDIDRLLQTRSEMTLSKWLADARDAAILDTDKQNFEINILQQLSLWGPLNDTVLYDMAWREWGGMIKTYYAPRWRMLLELLAGNFKGIRRISTVTRKQPFGRNDYRGSGFYRNMERLERNWIATSRPEEPSSENTVIVARELLNKYRKAITEE